MGDRANGILLDTSIVIAHLRGKIDLGYWLCLMMSCFCLLLFWVSYTREYSSLENCSKSPTNNWGTTPNYSLTFWLG
jgi:hypothetical protein